MKKNRGVEFLEGVKGGEIRWFSFGETYWYKENVPQKKCFL